MGKNRTERERQMALNKKRFRHELRKQRKDKNNGPIIMRGKNRGEYTPNLEAMFKEKKKK